MKSLQLPTALLATALAYGTLSAQTVVTTDPVGFVTVNVKANSDATIAVPLNRTAEFKGTISAIAGSVITVTGTPSWTVGQFVQALPAQPKTYAVRIASGAKEGLIGTITANTANSLTVALGAGDDLSGITSGASGDQVDILPYWTPETLFSVLPPVGLEISGFESPNSGVNVASSESFVHIGGNVWEDGINGGEIAHARLLFGAGLILRNPTAADYSATFVGAVPMTTGRYRFNTLAGNAAQDQYFGYMCPVPEPLATLSSANALGFPVAVGDTIQGFDNAESGINKGASQIFVWTGTAWEDGINGGDIAPNDPNASLLPGRGYIFQKAATTTPSTVVWVRTAGYLQ
jgi:uncharacterized protein (TIGR02597 family)